MTAAEELATWATSLRSADLPAAARDAVAARLLDGLGCAVAALRAGEAGAAVRVAERYREPAESTILGTASRVAAPYAALAGGALVHALDYDDTHPAALVHATAVVLPVLLAVGERTGAGGDALVTAAAAGYEALVRLGLAAPHGFHRRGFHATSVCGAVAASLVASRLLGLSRDRTVDALGIAGSLAAGSLEFLATGSSTKQLHPGFAAQAGVTAAELAAEGASGPATILEGGHGLYALYTGTAADREVLAGGLGRRWELLGIAVKPWAACQLSHASLDALARLLPVDVSSVERITVELPSDSVPVVAEPRAFKVRPRTAYEAKFSLPWCLAALAVDGGLTPRSFATVDRCEVTALAERVAVSPLEGTAPPGTATGHVRVAFRGGAERSASAPAGRVLAAAEVVAKFAVNVSGDASSPEAAAFAERLLHLPAEITAGEIAARLARLLEGVAV